MTEDLVAWLREQLDEDERLARTCPTFGWVAPDYDEGGDDDTGHVADAEGRIIVWDAPARISAHIARWEPTRVLREVETKRRLLAGHEPCETYLGVRQCGACADMCHSETGIGCDYPDAPWPCDNVRLLAAPYSDRPGYRQEWTP